MNGRALIYLRISEDRGGKEAGVERQREDCERRCRERGWDVVAIETDNDISATGGRRREGFESMLGAIKRGEVTYVVAWALDRLQRSRRDEVRLYELCRDHGITVSLVRGPDLEWETPTGRYLADNLGSLARMEVEIKGDRQRRANEQRASKGQTRWTRRPFGLDRDDAGSVIVVEREAEALRTASAAVLAGGTLAASVREMKRQGLMTTAGGSWNVTSLRRALLNPRYAGRAHYQGVELAETESAAVLATLEAEWPVIIDGDTQRQIEEVLRDPRRRVQQGTELKYLLSGSAICGRCGDRLFASTMGQGTERRMVYRCRTGHLARRLDLVDDVVVGVILARLARPDAVTLLAPDVDVDALRREADDLRGRRDDIAELLGEGLLGATAAREQASRLKLLLDDVERKIGASASSSPAMALALAGDIPATWAGLPMRTRRAIVDVLATVTILPMGKGYKFDPSTSASSGGRRERAHAEGRITEATAGTANSPCAHPTRSR